MRQTIDNLYQVCFTRNSFLSYGFFLCFLQSSVSAVHKDVCYYMVEMCIFILLILLQLSIWDTAGVERFRTVTKNYYRGAHACILVFSVDEPGSLQYLTHWVRDADEFCPDAVKFVIANKIDLEYVVNPDSMDLFASSHNCDHHVFKVSAKTGEGITEAFEKISKQLLHGGLSSSEERERSTSDVVGINQTPDPTVKQWRSGCCSNL